jgi:hypothetical protein
MSAITKPVGSRKRVLIWAAVIVIPIIAMALIAGTGGYLLWRAMGPATSKRDMTGLEGVWRDEDSPKHVYRFQKDGTLENSWGGLPFGEFGTWEREGDKITVRTIRDWDFEGKLGHGVIRGQVITRPNSNGIGEKTWKHEWPAN